VPPAIPVLIFSKVQNLILVGGLQFANYNLVTLKSHFAIEAISEAILPDAHKQHLVANAFLLENPGFLYPDEQQVKKIAGLSAVPRCEDDVYTVSQNAKRLIPERACSELAFVFPFNPAIVHSIFFVLPFDPTVLGAPAREPVASLAAREINGGHARQRIRNAGEHQIHTARVDGFSAVSKIGAYQRRIGFD
jgi:hypothetical protein